jgi:hypothetical protein
MSLPRPFCPYHFHADLIWWDGPLSFYDSHCTVAYMMPMGRILYKDVCIHWENIINVSMFLIICLTFRSVNHFAVRDSTFKHFPYRRPLCLLFICIYISAYSSFCVCLFVSAHNTMPRSLFLFAQCVSLFLVSCGVNICLCLSYSHSACLSIFL